MLLRTCTFLSHEVTNTGPIYQDLVTLWANVPYHLDLFHIDAIHKESITLGNSRAQIGRSDFVKNKVKMDFYPVFVVVLPLLSKYIISFEDFVNIILM